MKHAKQWLVYTRGFAITILCVIVALVTLGWLARPDVTTRPFAYTPEQIAAAEAARDVRFDRSDPSQLPDLHVDVDYSKSDDADWWPRNESPILRDLVEEGVYPPVEQRTGPEPCVMRGTDGIGTYGGTWHRIATHDEDIDVIRWRLSSTGLVRWSPLGYPIRPHLAKSVEALRDNREFIIRLRHGVRWSDGHPFTVDDILYWWETELDPVAGTGVVPKWMRSAGKPARLEKIDDLTLRIAFDEPNGSFMEVLASNSHLMVQHPKHFLSKYHPTDGDPAFLESEMRAFRMPGPRALYIYVKNFANPEHPRLWPWIPRTYRPTPPQVFVRNPYYWVVDERGNQLPYIDRVQFAVKSTQTLPLAFANGEVSMQTRHVRYENYTELMSRRDASGFRILHWYPATRSVWNINPNLNRLVDPDRPDTKWKAQLLADKRLRQALSLAINRKAIVQSEYNNQVRPAQVEPGPESPFHSPKLRDAYIEHDPARANKLLDELGLTKRGLDGMRLFPDGTPMVFYLDYSTFTGMGPAQFVVDDWGEVGVRVIAREQQRELFYARKDAGDFDFNIWSSESDFFPLLEPRVFVPDTTEAFYAPRWSRWFINGGYWGDPKADQIKMALKPAEDHPVWEAYVLYERALRAPTLEQQQELFARIADIVAENLWTIGIAEAPPQIVIVSKDMRNVPRNALYAARLNTPGNAGIETYYFENPRQTAASATKWELTHLTPRPRIGHVAAASPDSRGAAHRASAMVLRILAYTLIALVVCGILYLAIRFPFVARRLAIMVPTLLVISVAVFTIIQLPPGDFLTSRLIQLQETGDEAAMNQIQELRRIFHFDEPYWKQYVRWMGLRWLVTFDRNDAGLLQGNMGRSMGEQLKPVNQIVGDRIALTILISLGTILFTWTLAIPIGIYSAVRQYSPTDYALTLLGFVGMSVPGFLLALVLMSLAGVGTGLFSPRFAVQSQWDWPKFVDLLKHIWVPVVVLGVGGTASMIRIMRANLLDELRKPYVTTARAKGVRPLKLLIKYPVRMALNPFVSGIGHLFPQLVSGGAIVAIVLALPTVGPLMLQALFNQDMYVAGSMLMVLSMLGVIGTLVSDLLLLWLDPRIRYEGGAR